MDKKIKIIHLEDVSDDAEVVERELSKTKINYELLLVKCLQEFKEALINFNPDIVLSDHSFPSFDSLDVLETLKDKGPGIPLILVTGALVDELAIKIIKKGASDYILKDRLERLPIAVERVIETFRIEKEIQSGENRFQALIENSNDMVFLIDEDLNIKYVSPAVERLTGFTSRELLSRNFFKLAPQDHLNQAREKYEQVLNKPNCPVENTLQWINKNGSSIWVEGIVTNMLRVSGVQALVANYRDITDRHLANLELEKTSLLLEESLQDKTQILNHSIDVICSFDEAGAFLQVSKACESVWGYTPEELIGKKYMDMVDANDRHHTEIAAAEIISGIKKTNFENNYVKKDGSLVPILWSATWDDETKIMYCIAKDATEKKMLESALRTEQQRFHDLYLNAPTCICILKGPEHVFETANPFFLKITGEKNMIGKTMMDVFPELESLGFKDILGHVYQSGESYTGTERLFRIYRGNDDFFTDLYFNFIFQAYRNSQNIIESIFFFGIDVTEQVQSRKLVLESERRYVQVLENLPAAVYTCDLNGNILLYNKAATSLWGRTPVPGKDLWSGSWKKFSTDGVPILLENCAMAVSIKEKKLVRGVEVLIQKPDGEKRSVVAYPTLLYNSLGQMTGAINMMIDITENKVAQRALIESEERHRRIVETAQEGIWMLDKDNNTKFVNQQLCNLLEITAEEILGKKITSFIDLDDINQAEEHIWKRKLGISENFDIRFLTKSGKQIWTNVSASPIMSHDKKYLGELGMVMDITDRKKSEEETQILLKNLQTKNKDLRQFAYIVSHNLRSPIAKILSMVTLIKSKQNEEEFCNNLLHQIANEANNLDNVIKDINSIITGSNIGDKLQEYVSFSKEVALITQVLDNEIVQSKAEITFNFNEVEGMQTIKGHLYSIFYNLLSNAIKYRNQDIPLKIHFNSFEADDFVVLTLKDNGIGIDMVKNKDKIFGLYKRFHDTSIPGLGIGLNLVKAQVESLGGSIEVKSELGKGSIFKVNFPKKYGRNIA